MRQLFRLNTITRTLKRVASAASASLIAATLALVCAPRAAAQNQPPQQTAHGQPTAQTRQPAASQPPAPDSPRERPRRAVPADVLPEDPSEILKVDTNLVLVDVDVRDEAGRPVRNLRQQDFKLFDDGVERPIAFFNVEQKESARRPVAVVFAVDVSGSLTPEEMARIGQSLHTFAQRLYDRDSVFAVMTFGMRVNVLQNFTNNFDKLDRAFLKLEREPNGLSTHAYDAVDDAVRLLRRDAPRTRAQRSVKRAVVVVTDGFPVGDTVAPETVIERANAEGVSVYTLTLPSYSRLLAPSSAEHEPLPTPLDVSGLVEKTGGANVYANQKDFEPFFKSLADELVSTYVLAFYPPDPNRRDGRYHQIRVTAPGGFTIRQNRPGYKNNGG
ncbi:MAG: VWA domain-containing protein [Acidobacteria bacterium]|nr:VWA domain-containing protein [Acidobacteriota bacterium]